MTRVISRALFALVLAGGLAACSEAELLSVQTPDQITPDKANSPVGAAALRAAAIGNFAAFIGGDYGGSFHGLTITRNAHRRDRAARGGTEHLDSGPQNEAGALVLHGR